MCDFLCRHCGCVEIADIELDDLYTVYIMIDGVRVIIELIILHYFLLQFLELPIKIANYAIITVVLNIFFCSKYLYIYSL